MESTTFDNWQHTTLRKLLSKKNLRLEKEIFLFGIRVFGNREFCFNVKSVAPIVHFKIQIHESTAHFGFAFRMAALSTNVIVNNLNGFFKGFFFFFSFFKNTILLKIDNK